MFLLEIYRNECCEEVSSTWWVLCYCQISEWRRYCDGWRQAIALCVCVCVSVHQATHITYRLHTALVSAVKVMRCIQGCLDHAAVVALFV